MCQSSNTLQKAGNSGTPCLVPVTPSRIVKQKEQYRLLKSVGVPQHTTGKCRIITNTVADGMVVQNTTVNLNLTAYSRANCPGRQSRRSKNSGKQGDCLTCKLETMSGCKEERHSSQPWSCTNMSNRDLLWSAQQMGDTERIFRKQMTKNFPSINEQDIYLKMDSGLKTVTQGTNIQHTHVQLSTQLL